VAIDTANVEPRPNAGGVFEKRTAYDPLVGTDFGCLLVITDLKHLLSGIEEADIVDKQIIRIVFPLNLDAMISHSAETQIGNRETSGLHQKNMGDPAIHSIAKKRNGVTVAGSTTKGCSRGGNNDHPVQKIDPIGQQDSDSTANAIGPLNSSLQTLDGFDLYYPTGGRGGRRTER
jgi:hypothetical protein